MSERRHSEEDVVSSLPTHRWSSEAAAALEAAIEAINEAVAAYSELTALEEASDAPDEWRLAQWRAASAACARERRSLDPGDVRRLAEVRERYSRLARELVGPGR